MIRREEVIGDCRLILGDCLEILPTLGSVDAVVTDPPYGIGKDPATARATKWQRRAGKGSRDWDSRPETRLPELLALAPVRAVWGGNYYSLPASRGWLSWFKPDAPPSMASIELCWTNQDQNARQISCSIGATNAERVGHPTQKPVAVMRWTIDRLPFAQSILDPFMGSGTTGVACAKMGRSFIGIEIDEGYFEIALRRIREAYAQPDMLIEAARPAPKQESLL